MLEMGRTQWLRQSWQQGARWAKARWPEGSVYSVALPGIGVGSPVFASFPQGGLPKLNQAS